MIAFLLGLLKIIGIVLLILLITVVLLILIILFVPIRYCAEGHLGIEDKTGKASITWLAKIVRIVFNYKFPEKPYLSVKVFGIDIMKMLNTPPKNGTQSDTMVSKELNEIKKKNRKNGKCKPEKKEKKQKYHPAVNIALLEAADAEAAAKEEALKKETSVNREEAFISKTTDLSKKNKFEKIIFKITGIYDKIIHIWNNIEYYISVFEEPDTKSLLKDAWISVSKILNSVKPQKFRLYAEVGFDYPDTTAKVYGYYCMVMPWLSDDIVLTPVFEEKIIDAEIYISGKIRLITILINGLRIVFDKRLKPLLKKIKNGGSKNG